MEVAGALGGSLVNSRRSKSASPRSVSGLFGGGTSWQFDGRDSAGAAQLASSFEGGFKQRDLASSFKGRFSPEDLVSSFEGGFVQRDLARLGSPRPGTEGGRPSGGPSPSMASIDGRSRLQRPASSAGYPLSHRYGDEGVGSNSPGSMSRSPDGGRPGGAMLSWGSISPRATTVRGEGLAAWCTAGHPAASASFNEGCLSGDERERDEEGADRRGGWERESAGGTSPDKPVLQSGRGEGPLPDIWALTEESPEGEQPRLFYDCATPRSRNEQFSGSGASPIRQESGNPGGLGILGGNEFCQGFDQQVHAPPFMGSGIFYQGEFSSNGDALSTPCASPSSGHRTSENQQNENSPHTARSSPSSFASTVGEAQPPQEQLHSRGAYSRDDASLKVSKLGQNIDAMLLLFVACLKFQFCCIVGFLSSLGWRVKVR